VGQIGNPRGWFAIIGGAQRMRSLKEEIKKDNHGTSKK
jgi:hypothetical protein